MQTTFTPRTGTGILALASILIVMALFTAGCSDDSSPTTMTTADVPVVPNPTALQFDFSFFEQGETLEKSRGGTHENYVNAYLRAVVLGAMANLTLAAPTATLAVALHTVPVVQDDGSWVWSYLWNGYRYPIRVALRGMPAGDHVQWEMRIGAGGEVPTALWFEGSTSGDGAEGHWLFHDLDDPAQPLCGEVAWGDADGGRFLEFTSREMENNGDVLRFTDSDPDFAITFTPGDSGEAWFIQWHADGTGSLMVPDYRDGEVACWDQWQENVDCQ
jgi:hypothetical protein